MAPPHILDLQHRTFLRIYLPTTGRKICGPLQARVSQEFSPLVYACAHLSHYCRFESPRFCLLVLCARPGLSSCSPQCVRAQGFYHSCLEQHVRGVHKEGLCHIFTKIERGHRRPRWKHQECHEETLSSF